MDSPAFAVDLAADDGWVVVLRRDPHGAWELESAECAACVDIADLVKRMVARMPAPAYRPPAADERPLTELVEEWMAAHAGDTFEMDAEQRSLVEALYDLTDGQVRHVDERLVAAAAPGRRTAHPGNG